jgi:hypothetical protein
VKPRVPHFSPTNDQLRAHGAKSCPSSIIHDCRICVFLNRQLVNGIRGVLGLDPLGHVIGAETSQPLGIQSRSDRQDGPVRVFHRD